jgi:hypothetical protein
MDVPVTRQEVRRAIYAILAVVAAEVIGTIGFELIENPGWVNAFYFESMLATGQGPPFTLYTNSGKVFASIMGFVSVGSTLSAVIFVVGPLVLRLWHQTLASAEREVRIIEGAVARDVRKLEEDLSPHAAAEETRPPAQPPP